MKRLRVLFAILYISFLTLSSYLLYFFLYENYLKCTYISYDYRYKKKHVRYCPYMPITRVNSDYHEISQEKTVTVEDHHKYTITIAGDNHLVQHSSLRCSPLVILRRRLPPIGIVFLDPRSSSVDSDVGEKKKKKSEIPHTKQMKEKKWTRSQKRLLYSRECPREYAEWKSEGERGRREREGRRQREVHLTPKHLRALARWCTVRESVVCRLLCFDSRTPRASCACAMILLGLCSGRD